MPAEPGQTLLHYRIVEKIGEGGMGVVWKALDTTLDREVAIKLLPEEVATDAERLARFEREAKLLASLNHPNITAVYGLDESDSGQRFISMELIEGDDLAERLARGPLSVENALDVARQIAEALEAAHEAGVIHRDLKPANVKRTADGKVKVLDFGLAKALAIEAEQASDASPSLSPTVSSVGSVAGAILGTAAYMSPEQAKGKAVDKRADIWAFGVMLYEMLSGRQLFEGDSLPEILGAIFREEIALDDLPANTPRSVRALVGRCLQRDPRHRLRDIGEARIALQPDALADARLAEALAPGQTAWRGPWVVAVAAGVAVIAMLAALAVWMRPASAPGAGVVSRTQIGVEPAEGLADVVFQNFPSLLTRTGMTWSPDGQVLVFAGRLGDDVQLFRRDLDALDAIAIAGTEGASGPFFSPDGRWIGFHAPGGLHKVPLSGGPPVLVAEFPPPFGASWGDNDLIVLGHPGSGLLGVSAEGGDVRPLTELDADRGELSHRLPYLLPGAEAVLFTVRTLTFGRWQRARIEVQSLVTDERTVLIENGADARYVPTGHIVFTRLGTLMAVPFDVETLTVTGGPRALLEGVAQAANLTNTGWDTGAAQVSVSETGTLAYLAGGIEPDQEHTLRQFDRSGRVETLPIDPGPFYRPRFSPDGQRLVVGHMGMAPELWVHDLARGGRTRLGTDGYNGIPLWTPDGARVTFVGSARGPTDLFWQVADGNRPPERLSTATVGPGRAVPGAWSADGRVLAFVQSNQETRQDIWTLTVGEAGSPQPLIHTPASESDPEFSPDGRWLAYVSTESGQLNVYVKRYPPTEERFRVSPDGGFAPAWSPDGTELFYLTSCPDQSCFPYRQLMVADVATAPTFEVSVPRPVAGVYLFTGTNRSWDISPDGQRFLTVQREERADRPPRDRINIVQNWFEELKRLVPVD